MSIVPVLVGLESPFEFVFASLTHCLPMPVLRAAENDFKTRSSWISRRMTCPAVQRDPCLVEKVIFLGLLIAHAALCTMCSCLLLSPANTGSFRTWPRHNSKQTGLLVPFFCLLVPPRDVFRLSHPHQTQDRCSHKAVGKKGKKPLLVGVSMAKGNGFPFYVPSISLHPPLSSTFSRRPRNVPQTHVRATLLTNIG